MANLTFFNVPAHGHVNPTLALVGELTRRGHRVVYYDTEPFRSAIENVGAEFRAYPQSVLSADALNERASTLVLVTLLLLEASFELLPFVLAELDREQPDVVLFDSICLWGQQGAALHASRTITSITTLIAEGVKGALNTRDKLHALRQAAPLARQVLSLRRQLESTYGSAVFPHKDIFPAIGDMNLLYTSQEFQPATPFIDETFRFVGPMIDPAARVPVAFPFDDLTRRPLVYISMGTIHQSGPEFLSMLYEAFADYPGQFVLSAGQGFNSSLQKDAPANFLVLPTVPQLKLLEQADAFVTHGGMNSVHEGLWFGVPLVVIPQHFEQLFNGRQVASHGAGILLGDRPPYGQVTAVELRSAVDRVLSDKAIQSSAHSLGASLKEAGGYQYAADEVERFLTQ